LQHRALQRHVSQGLVPRVGCRQQHRAAVQQQADTDP
jgi:hypothetical protein